MGRDKAQLRLPGGESLLERAERMLAGLPAPAGLEFLPAQISGAGGVADWGKSRGPLSGLHAVAEMLERERPECAALLAMPVDMPLLQAAQLQLLCNAALRSGARALCFGRYWLPLWLRLDANSRAHLREAALGRGDPSVRALFAACGGEQLPAPSGDWHWNINRPDEFNRAKERIAALEN